MNPTEEFSDDDLGIEYYDDIVAKQSQNQPTMGQEALRHGGRASARIGETLIGLPGDIREVLTNVAIGVPEYFAGEELPRWRASVRGLDSGAVGGFGVGDPTSQILREGVTKEITGEYFEPQNEYERFGDEIAQDFATLALPVKGRIPFARALGTSLIANTGKEIAEAFGGETAGAVTKLGLLFTSGLIGQGGGAKKYINNLYDEMETSIPTNAAVGAKKLENKIGKIESVLRRGDVKDASKAPVFQKITAIKNKISDGKIDVEELVALNKSTNEAIFTGGELTRGKTKLYDVRNAIHETLADYGAENKDFLNKWKNANEAYAATQLSRNVGNWVRKNISPKDYVYAASALGLEGAALGAPAALTTIGAGAGLAATAYSAEVMKRIAQSPALRRHYMNVVSNSLKQNTGGFTRAIKQLDKGLEKSFDENPYETVEFED